MLPCLSKSIWGFECPGCGLQRSVAFLFQGEFAAAWEMWPAIFTIIPLFGFIFTDVFIKIKKINSIIILLSISSVILILGNYILKFI
jgi:hypothetical protein